MLDPAQIDDQEGAVIPAVRYDAASMAVPLGLAFAAVGIPTAIIMVAICLVSTVIPWWVGMLVGLGFGAWVVSSRFRNAHDLVRTAVVHGAPATDGNPRIVNLVESMALTGGVMQPSILVVSDKALNAMAIRRGDESTIVVTDGLLSTLELIELEGVVGELIARLRNGDAEAATVYTSMFELGPGLVGAMLGWAAKPARARLLSEERDLVADLQAVALTRYPPGLFGALRRISQDSAEPLSASGSIGAMWIADPAHQAQETGSTIRVQGVRAPLELRMDILAEL